jgi:ABC-type Fe3+-hydroxamate transport system substrate-binding protein
MNTKILWQLKEHLYPNGQGGLLHLPQKPKRIVSLVPSQTELLYHFGLEEEVVGITKFCVHPEKWFRNKTRVGGTKSPHIDKIKKLEPDLIIANKEENRREDIEALGTTFPVYVSDIENLDDALQMITDLGALTGKTEAATALSKEITSRFNRLEDQVAGRRIKTAYLIWQEPYMAAGNDTFIHDMMRRAGFDNVFSDWNRYPEVVIEILHERGTECLLLSSEPYPFKEKHIAALQTRLPGVKILLADGEMFSWYGSRLLEAPEYFMQLILQLNS